MVIGQRDSGHDSSLSLSLFFAFFTPADLSLCPKAGTRVARWNVRTTQVGRRPIEYCTSSSIAEREKKEILERKS